MFPEKLDLASYSLVLNVAVTNIADLCGPLIRWLLRVGEG